MLVSSPYQQLFDDSCDFWRTYALRLTSICKPSGCVCTLSRWWRSSVVRMSGLWPADFFRLVPSLWWLNCPQWVSQQPSIPLGSVSSTCMLIYMDYRGGDH